MPGVRGKSGRVSIQEDFNQLSLFDAVSWRVKRKRRLAMTQSLQRTALGEKILQHWREHCPQMVRDLQEQNRLEEAVLAAQETTGDLLYELVSVKKMSYPAAWEIATQEWAIAENGR